MIVSVGVAVDTGLCAAPLTPQWSLDSGGVLTDILWVKVAFLDARNEGRLQFASCDLRPIDIPAPRVLLDLVRLALRDSLVFVFMKH